MNICKSAALALVSLTATGCVSALATRTYTRTDQPSEVVRSPVLQTVTESEVGQSMIFTAQRSVYPAIQLGTPVMHEGSNLDKKFVLTIPQGPLKQRGIDSSGVFYQADHPLPFNVNSGVIKVKGGVYVPSQTPSATEVYWLATDNNAIPLNDPHAGIQFQKVTVEEWGESSFKRELVYGGISQDTITISYREFVNDIARPAFTQDLKYDLSKGKEIGFRGSRFEVLNATNTSITYKVTKHLE
jgi:hypothetical protein